MVANCYIPFGQGLHVTQLGPDATLASACDSAAPVPCLGGPYTSLDLPTPCSNLGKSGGFPFCPTFVPFVFLLAYPLVFSLLPVTH